MHSFQKNAHSFEMTNVFFIKERAFSAFFCILYKRTRVLLRSFAFFCVLYNRMTFSCILYKRTRVLLISFAFFIKECVLLKECAFFSKERAFPCVLLHSFQKNAKECNVLLGFISCKKFEKRM